MNGYSGFSHQLKFHLTKPGALPHRLSKYCFDHSLWYYIPVLNQVADLSMLSDMDLLFPRKKKELLE